MLTPNKRASFSVVCVCVCASRIPISVMTYNERPGGNMFVTNRYIRIRDGLPLCNIVLAIWLLLSQYIQHQLHTVTPVVAVPFFLYHHFNSKCIPLLNVYLFSYFFFFSFLFFLFLAQFKQVASRWNRY